jgi:hypothetical protein
MSDRKNTVPAGALLVTGALLLAVCLAALHAHAAPSPAPTGDGKEDINDLKKRVAKLEAEIAELRKALRQAAGPDSVTEIKHVREVAKLRAADLLQRAQNTHAILREVMNGKAAGLELQNRINDLNNELTALWMVLAGYGLGREPYLDSIQVNSSGSGRGKPPPDFGIPGPYVGIGLPRLHERYLEASGIKGRAADQLSADFKKLVHAYSNPAVYQHRAFYERAYGEYRDGKNLFTPQYVADLKTLDQWLTELEAVLGRVPEHFEKAP